ncbi:MAG: hypothetical protein HOV67_34665 [Kribbellaceae bacterium]|nr:hypothetical protein [Kribbellaceae bacterium]
MERWLGSLRDKPAFGVMKKTEAGGSTCGAFTVTRSVTMTTPSALACG